MMTVLIIISAFIGVAALVGSVATMFQRDEPSAVEDRLKSLTSAAALPKGDAKVENQSLMAGFEEQPDFFEAIFSRHFNVKRFLEQADSPINSMQLGLYSLGLGGAGGAICLYFGFLLYAPLAFGLLASFPFVWLYLRRSKRLGRFGKQMPEALELISRALRAGHSLGAGFRLVADEMAEPISKEFGRCYEEQNLGVPLEETLQTMADRVPNLDLRFFATAVILQRQTGGDLAEILDKIGYLVRERFKIYGQVQALTGEGRLSGIVLLALPPVLFLVMLKLNPGYVMMLFNDPLGQQMLAGGIVMQVLGAIVIQKIITIKV